MRTALYTTSLAVIAACAIAFQASRTDAASAAPPGTFQALRQDGVAGGELTSLVPGTPEQVLDMLLDFDHADGHRAWARHYHTVKRSGGDPAAGGARVVARWQFHGKMGVDPEVELEFTTERDGDQIVVPFHITDASFGLAVFSGEVRLAADPDAPDQTRLTQRVYISSGLPFVDASTDDIEKGLREDARLMTAWMTARTSP